MLALQGFSCAAASKRHKGSSEPQRGSDPALGARGVASAAAWAMRTAAPRNPISPQKKKQLLGWQIRKLGTFDVRGLRLSHWNCLVREWGSPYRPSPRPPRPPFSRQKKDPTGSGKYASPSLAAGHLGYPLNPQPPLLRGSCLFSLLGGICWV